MLGRGAMANPFLPGQIKGVEYTQEEKLYKAQAFYQHVADEYEKVLSGPDHFLQKLKEFWVYYQYLFEQGPKLFNKLKKTKKIDDYHLQVNNFFALKPAFVDQLEIRSNKFL